ncbi:MAG: TrmH family RNA methyltransferase [Desulfovermiculus sp.]
MLFPHLTVILCRPKLSENIGSVARVCANMGCSSLALVAPRAFSPETARSLATSQGEKILSELKVHTDSMRVFSASQPASSANCPRTARTWPRRLSCDYFLRPCRTPCSVLTFCMIKTQTTS